MTRFFLFSLLILSTLRLSAQTLDQQLFTALDNKQIDLAKELISKGANVNALYDGSKYSGSKGWTVFLFAMVTTSDVDFMKYLVAKGANPNTQIPNYESYNYAIHHAAENNMSEMTSYLIDELKVSPNLPDGGGMPPLSYACIGRYPNPDYLQLLIDKGAHVNHQTESGYTALHWAVGYQELGLVKKLVENGADISLKSTFGSPRQHVRLNALAVAMSYKNVEIFNYLLSKGIDYKWADSEYSPIYVAAYWGFPYAINKLMAMGVNKDKADAFGETPLNIAVENGNKLVQQILMYGPSETDKKLFRMMEDPSLSAIKITMSYQLEGKSLVKSLSGGTADIKDYLNPNGITFINFWATWCPPCVKEMPSMQKMNEHFGSKLTVVAVSCDKTADLVEGFKAKKPEYKFSYLHDPEWGLYSELGSSLPGSFIIGKTGTILASCSGSYEWDNPKALELLEVLTEY
jgi:ankyrin repeat protein